jgi:hypothetical protein
MKDPAYNNKNMRPANIKYNLWYTFLMFDTHAHLNFSRFKKNLDEVIALSKESGVSQIVIPGTDVESSKKAVILPLLRTKSLS